MQVKNRRQEKVCVSKLNSAFFLRKMQKGKEQKERDKSRNPIGSIYRIPNEQNYLFSCYSYINIFYTIKIISGEKIFFQLDNEQLKEIARSFKAKVEEGLNTENAEIQCIPTFITPKASGINGKSLVLDLGGTNYRVAIVDFSKMPPTIHPNNGWKKDMSIMKTPGYTREELFKEMADMITGIKREKEMPIGYCFSYPTESVPGGDAKLLRWTKGVDIKEMIGEVVGKPFARLSE